MNVSQLFSITGIIFFYLAEYVTPLGILKEFVKLSTLSVNNVSASMKKRVYLPFYKNYQRDEQDKY